MDDKMPKKRYRHLCLMIVSTFVACAILAVLNGLQIDGVLSYFIFVIVFSMLLVYMMERNRIDKKICNDNSSDYGDIAKIYSCFCLLLICFYFFPSYTCPVIMFSLFLSILSNQEIGISLSLALCILLCCVTGHSFYEISAYCVLILFGAQMSKTMEKKQLRKWGCIILVSISVLVPTIFHYLAKQESSLMIILVTLVLNSVLTGVYLYVAERLYDRNRYGNYVSVETIISEDYPLVQDIKKFSKAEYVHAMKVSTIARKCAIEIGADELTVAAAGFYYRLGILEGEPYVENGVKLAADNCFPPEVIQVLREYNGELQNPSTKESAIVHMVDACLKRLELLYTKNLSTSWNQDMVIYQVLNELSASGIYDQSGLSMNQFLKIRERLVREELGYDN